MMSSFDATTAAITGDIQLANGAILTRDHAEAEYQNLVTMTAARRFNDWTYDLIRPYIGTRVLEVGSGFATFTTKMVAEGKHVVGLDVNPVHMRIAKERCPEATYLLHDIATGIAPLKGQAFDTMIALNVFEHIEDDHQAMRSVFEALQPGGRAVVLVPAHPFIFGRLDVMSGHFRRYNRKMARELLTQAGFDVVALQWFNPWSMAAMFFKNRIKPADSLSTPSVELFDRLVPLFRTIEKVIPPVIGQSILAVGQKPAA